MVSASIEVIIGPPVGVQRVGEVIGVEQNSHIWSRNRSELVSGVGFVRTALAHRTPWLEKRKDEAAEHKGLLIRAWPRGHHGCAVISYKGTSYRWGSELDLTPGS